MTLSFKSAAAFLAASVACGAASAAGPTATFRYDPALPAEATYASFEKQARSACRSDSKMLLVKAREEAACQSDMMERIVKKAGNKEIAALHHAKSGDRQPTRQFAAMD
ncbi:hypothetical protein HPO_00270 [Hyphomonas polymorpha PS728]|uniref:UrcA family protein n=1 Tax=Hyphomonas polymorpha PS728 TaxID=1280954 RepID=A0A062VL47_9PROT|nr:hypothetical protein [Hyphomonas polymorpha]KDA00417.1 hypothetical protein HPO_00270 [Hyphomonas polymorpha PS728]